MSCELNALWERIKSLEDRRHFDGEAYPKQLVSFPGRLGGRAFFPGGDGLWRTNPADTHRPPFPVRGIMIVGNGFGCLDNPDPRSPGFLQCLAKGFEDPPTWKIKETLLRAMLPAEHCFFTNAYLGLRTGTKTTGPSPGACNLAF